jgi:protein TonB
MSLSDVRRVLKATEDMLEVSALAAGFETKATFRRDGARMAVLFPGKVTPRSKTGLEAVRWCVARGDRTAAEFAAQVRSEFGEPTSGGASLDAGLRDGAATWKDAACPVEVRALREAEWWDPSAEKLCVEVRVTGPIVEPPAALAVREPPPVEESAVPALEGAASDTASDRSARRETKAKAEKRPSEPAIPIADPLPDVISLPEAKSRSAPVPADEAALSQIPPRDVEPPRQAAATAAVTRENGVADDARKSADRETSAAREPSVVREPSAAPGTSAALGPAAAPEPPAAARNGAEDGAPEVATTASAPRLVESVPVQYPPLLRGRKVSARVVVRATVLPDGSVGDVVVSECNRPGLGFEGRVVAAVRKWHYEPARQGDVAVTAEILIPFNFE